MPVTEDLNQKPLVELHQRKDQDQRALKQNLQRKDQRRDPVRHLRKEAHPRKAPDQSPLNQRLKDPKDPRDLKRVQDLQVVDHNQKADLKVHTNKRPLSINFNTVKSQSTWSSTTTSRRI